MSSDPADDPNTPNGRPANSLATSATMPVFLCGGGDGAAPVRYGGSGAALAMGIGGSGASNCAAPQQRAVIGGRRGGGKFGKRQRGRRRQRGHAPSDDAREWLDAAGIRRALGCSRLDRGDLRGSGRRGSDRNGRGDVRRTSRLRPQQRQVGRADGRQWARRGLREVGRPDRGQRNIGKQGELLLEIGRTPWREGREIKSRDRPGKLGWRVACGVGLDPRLFERRDELRLGLGLRRRVGLGGRRRRRAGFGGASRQIALGFRDRSRTGFGDLDRGRLDSANGTSAAPAAAAGGDDGLLAAGLLRVVCAAAEHPGEPCEEPAAARRLNLSAALLDLGLGQVVARHWLAVGRNEHRLAVGEEAG